MPVAIRPATEADLPLLAAMNRRLIEDEGSRNRMSIDELRERMRGWLAGEWRVAVLDEDGAVVGYAVWQERRDQYDPDRAVVHLRQFYVEREHRRRGIGRRAFELLVARFPPGATIDIDVLATNPGGHAFWRSLGFETYCTTMKRTDAFAPPSLPAQQAKQGRGRRG
jgi:GNAT superfamily N-acetyltransferase